MTGTLYGLGVGPGDPELMTLKAVRLLQQVPVIAYPAADDGDSSARAIAAGFVPPNATEIAIKVPMRPGRMPTEIYDAAAEKIAGHIAEGARAFLRREYRVLGVFVLSVAVLLALVNAASRVDEVSGEVINSPLIAVSFIVGALCSAAAGFIGMNVATKAIGFFSLPSRHL